jgi:hypothetical protein
MIFLKSLNVLFLKPRNVGGTAFEIALSKFAGPDDIITPVSSEDETTRSTMGFVGPQNFDFERKVKQAGKQPLARKQLDADAAGRKFFNFISAKMARMRLGGDVFDNATKVSIVRNPYDRLLSQYLWATREVARRPDFGEWLRLRPEAINGNDQTYFIGKREVIDHYVRYEAFDEDIASLERRVPGLDGLGAVFSEIQAKSVVHPAEAFLEEFFADRREIVEAIWFFNQPHIERFHYGRP